jgi:hypothetical protein
MNDWMSEWGFQRNACWNISSFFNLKSILKRPYRALRFRVMFRVTINHPYRVNEIILPKKMLNQREIYGIYNFLAKTLSLNEVAFFECRYKFKRSEATISQRLSRLID